MNDDYQDWNELAAADPELAALMLRIDTLAEPLRASVVKVIQAMLDAAAAAALTSMAAEARSGV